MICLSQIQWSYKSSSITSTCAASVFTLHLRPPRPPRLRCPRSRSGFRHPRSHVDDLVSAELLGGISLLLPADTDLQTPLEGELGLNLLLLSQGKTLFHQLDPLGGPRSRPRTSLAMNGNVVMSKQNSLSQTNYHPICVVLCCVALVH